MKILVVKPMAFACLTLPTASIEHASSISPLSRDEHPMATCTAQAIISVSVDLELEIAGRSDWLESRLAQYFPKLLQVLDQFGVPATWCVADPSASAALDTIAAGSPGHSVAVLADRSWLGPNYPAIWQSRELARRFGRARQAGYEVNTLALHNIQHAPAWPVLQAHGIANLRLSPDTSLESPTALTLPLTVTPSSDWPLPLSAWNFWKSCPVRQALQACRAAMSAHWVIDGQQLAVMGDRMIRLVSRTLSLLEAWRKTGQGIRFIPLGTQECGRSMMGDSLPSCTHQTSAA